MFQRNSDPPYNFKMHIVHDPNRFTWRLDNEDIYNLLEDLVSLILEICWHTSSSLRITFGTCMLCVDGQMSSYFLLVKMSIPTIWTCTRTELKIRHVSQIKIPTLGDNEGGWKMSHFCICKLQLFCISKMTAIL